MVELTNLRYYPEYILFQVLRKHGIHQNNSASSEWNCESSEIHSIWDEFYSELKRNGYVINRTSYSCFPGEDPQYDRCEAYKEGNI